MIAEGLIGIDRSRTRLSGASGDNVEVERGELYVSRARAVHAAGIGIQGVSWINSSMRIPTTDALSSLTVLMLTSRRRALAS
jgi:hypothetical protein